MNFSSAQVGYTLPAEVPGTWTGEGYHYAVSDFYMIWCYYGFCGYAVHTATLWFDAGYSAQSILSLGLPTIISMDIARYSTTALTDDDVTAMLATASAFVSFNDGPADVSCPTVFTRSGSIRPFSDTDGIISNLQELAAVVQQPELVQAVNAIDWCFGFPTPPFTIRGCGGEFGVIVTRMSNPVQEGILWPHEYGHYKGLSHNPNPDYIMSDPNVPTNTMVTQNECDHIRN